MTGLPASGKSTVTAALVKRLVVRGVHPQVLESDELRRAVTPRATYSEMEREQLYATLVYVGRLLSKNGVNVIFDATANRRSYRDRARAGIPRFMEVYVKCPLEVAVRRDQKGTYEKARRGLSSTVPGVQSVYEEPCSPELVVESDSVSPDQAADRILEKMVEMEFLPGC